MVAFPILVLVLFGASVPVRAMSPCYQSPEMSQLLRQAPPRGLISLSGVGLTANGILAVADQEGTGTAIYALLGVAWGTASMMVGATGCHELEGDELREYREHGRVSELPESPEVQREVVRANRRIYGVLTGISVLYSGGAYWIADDKYREAIAWTTLGTMIVPMIFYAGRLFGEIETISPSETRMGQGARLSPWVQAPHSGGAVGLQLRAGSP